MPRIPLVFGSGLDRETGVMAMRPGGMEDVRNVHLLEGKFQVRRGFERVLTFIDPSDNEQTHILGGVPVLGERAAIYVTYDSVNGLVNVWHGDAEATWVSYIGEWLFTDGADNDLLPAGSDPPEILADAIYGIAFLAHTHNRVESRAQTCTVRKNQATGQWELALLTVDWETTQKVRFRGVRKHLEYMTGWGWGSDGEDRPEYVRVSLPDDPTVFEELHYWIPGDKGDPVVACYSAVDTLICFKETQVWECYGDSYLNFGQRPIDEPFGMLYPRMAVSVEGAVFAWTNEGPRVYTGRGSSYGLELPLELTLPEPYDLPVKGDDEAAFAVYMPAYRSVWWVFGRRVYSLYIRHPDDWKWGYQELAFEAQCGFRLPQAGYGLVTQPTGYPSGPALGDITDTTATLTVTNNDQDGDETLEVWIRREGEAAYALHQSFPVTTAGSQAHALTSLPAGWEFDLAVRYKRGAYYTAGYTSSDPDAWPASARTGFTTTLASLPTIDSVVWHRASASVEQILVTVTPPYNGPGYDVELRRGGALIYTFEDITGTEGFYDEGFDPEAENDYDCRVVTPHVNGSYTADTTAWGGPPAPTFRSADPGDDLTYEVEWTNGMSASTEVYDSLPSEDEVDVQDNLRTTAAAGEDSFTTSMIAGSAGLTPWIGLRHKLTQYTVDDFSELVTQQLSAPISGP